MGRERPVIVFDPLPCREPESDAAGSGNRPVVELDPAPDRSPGARLELMEQHRRTWARVTGRE